MQVPADSLPRRTVLRTAVALGGTSALSACLDRTDAEGRPCSRGH